MANASVQDGERWSTELGLAVRERELKLAFFYNGETGLGANRVVCVHNFGFRSRRAMAAALGLGEFRLKGAKDDPDRLSRDTLMALESYLGFDSKWQEWTNGTARDFALKYNRENTFSAAPAKYTSIETGVTERETMARLRVGPSVSRNIEGKERLSSIVLGFMQSPAGEPWPVILQLRCQNDTLDQFEVAVKRGWLQIDAGQHGEVRVKELKSLSVNGSEGLVSISAPGGKGNRTTWDISSHGNFIGVVELPDAFCSIDNLAAGDKVVARFAAFVKDLENVSCNDEARPEKEEPINDSLSWRRLGYHTLGAAKQAIMLRVAQLTHLPGADKGWVVLCEEERAFSRKDEDPNGG